MGIKAKTLFNWGSHTERTIMHSETFMAHLKALTTSRPPSSPFLEKNCHAEPIAGQLPGIDATSAISNPCGTPPGIR
jgi:hypothetical protein